MNNKKTSPLPDDRDWMDTAIKAFTWIFRLLLGGTFIFSGFVKAIDPWGTLYKFEEYMAAMGLPVLHTLLVTGVFALCAFEFILGVSLAAGCYRKSAPMLAVATMCFMLPLTFWIAVSDPVSDCGCFGDFFLISNWSTFWKNVLLTLIAVWLIRFNRCCITIISPAFQWLGVVISLAYIFAVSMAGYVFQPLLEFRPYRTGTPLLATTDDDYETDFTFVYEKDGVKKEFGVDDELPDEESGWTFVERRGASDSEMGKETDEENEKTFRIWSRDGSEDVTEQALTNEGTEVLLLIPSLSEVSPATTWKINALREWTYANGGEMIAVTDGTPEQISAWEEMALPDYDIYTADDTAIKELARGNPAIVLLEDGEIKWKTTLSAINADRLESDGKSFQPSQIITAPQETLNRITWLYIICMAVPVAMSFMPRIRHMFRS